MSNCHPDHHTRISMVASSYDEICELCGRTDHVGGWGRLADPCPAYIGDLAVVQERLHTYFRTHRVWKHLKTGGIYVVELVCIREQDQEPMVVYSGESETSTGIQWVRPVREFLDGRFTRMEIR